MVRCYLKIALVLLAQSLFYCVAPAMADGNYPWNYYFERPDHPYIHRAFADGDGDLIISTGDWLDIKWAGGVKVYVYWSTGIFRIRDDNLDVVDCPEDTFVLDAAVDAEGRTWVTYGRGIDHYEYDLMTEGIRGDDLKAPVDYVYSGPHHGYRPWYTPLFDVDERRLGLLGYNSLSEVSELTSAIPGEIMCLNCDASGRLFVTSQDRHGQSNEYFLSWWDGDSPNSIQIEELDVHPYGFPSFGPDGRVYMQMGYGRV